MIVVTAATPWEASPLRKYWGLHPRGSRAAQGVVGSQAVMVLETGIGPRKTEEALDAIGDISGPLVVISSGLAGALQPGIRSGEVVADLRGAPLELLQAAQAAAQQLDCALHLGSFYCADRVLASPAQKRAAGESQRAVAVDMESATVRTWCEKHGGTFLALRAVLDTVDQRLLPDVYEGEGSAKDLACYALKHWMDLPLLLGIGIRQKRAMSRLTRFTDAFLKRI